MGLFQMNARELYDRADSISENAFFKILGRGIMVVVGPAAIGMMGWVGNALWDMKAEQAKMTGEMNVLRTTIELQMSDRYRGSDAARDFRIRDQKDVEQDRRIQSIETRLDRQVVPTPR